ncbi:hypothetical protein F442_21435 [Phytophthora nicotianae P10297]|uniref:Uncharacterized protein n=1 Tax=Phytophthora nicotianae P10297 TaxID=1317064 RepID=W2Y5E5_PHYNI|nr:hypothetical protein F442_21435 [Phytophthora nicotianae P10297]
MRLVTDGRSRSVLPLRVGWRPVLRSCCSGSPCQ